MNGKKFFGHEQTLNHLRRQIADENFPHAVIFAGTEGVGKRLAAEICAAAILCESPVNGEACGVCENCKLFAAGTHPDFYVVEPEVTKTTRNIKIGQIREMQTEAALKPINSARRVVIIDGAEFMNKAAANCLLKTIEEPPSQTIFILVTANRSSLPITIRSRCQTVNFDKLTPAQIQTALVERGVEQSEAERLAIIADGSFGRALKLQASDGGEIRERSLDVLEKIFRGEMTNEEIFTFGATAADWSREQLAEFITHLQKILRDIALAEDFPPRNPDLLPRVSAIKIPDRKIFALIETGVQFFRRLNSNAGLRLLAEAYLMSLRKIFRD